MTLRSKVFWQLDRMRGGHARRALQNIERLNQPSSEELRFESLKSQLEFVTAEVPHYQRLRGNLDLSAFPVVSKEIIRQDSEHFVARQADPRAAHVVSSSGSTGEPFQVFQDAARRRHANAESIYFGAAAGYEIGQSLFHLKIWTERNDRGRMDNLARNIHPIDIRKFREDDASEFLRAIASMRSRISIIAYSSALETLARVIKSGLGATIQRGKVASIIGMSEPLSEEARRIIHAHTGTFPVARYGIEELGIIAQQSPSDSRAYRISTAGRVVEVLKRESDEPTSPGELGRIVVTDLVNRVQPLIRYDTKDLGVLDDRTHDGEGLWIDRLEGRSIDQIYDVDNKPLSSLISYAFWWKYPEIYQYQIVQSAQGTYVLRINAPSSFAKEAELVSDFREQVGAGAHISVEHTSTDFYHKSGKRRPIVGLFAPGTSI